MRRQASRHRFAYVRIAELLDNGAGTHLVDMLLVKQTPGGWRVELRHNARKYWTGAVDVVEHYAYLWESTREDE